MGNLESGNSQSVHQSLADYTEIRKQNNGVVLVDKKSENTYFLKEFNFVNKKQYENQFKRLQQLQSEPQSENILPLLRLFSQTFNNICSTSYRIYALYEYPSTTLEEQIAARKKQNKYFQECELWSILQSCANALSQLKPTLSLHPRNVFIVPDGVLKIINNEMIDEDYRCFVKENVYYAPEKIQQFKRNDNEDLLRKESIFSLGMTLLHAALLQPVSNCYNYQNFSFNKDMLQKSIQCLVNIKNLNESKTNEPNRLYSEQFIETLAMILEPCPNKRVSLMQVHGMLNKIWSTETEENCKEEDLYDNLQNSIKQSKQQETNSKPVEQKNLVASQTVHNHLESIDLSKKNADTIHQSFVSKNVGPSESLSFLPSFQHSQRNSKFYIHEQTNLNNRSTSNFAALNTSSQNLTTSNNYYPYTYIPEYKPYSIGQPYLSSTSSSSNFNANLNKQNNLYTDPKLLEMIRKDLRDLNELKKSSMMSAYGGYPTSSYNNSIYNYSLTGENEARGMFSSKSSLSGFKNTQQVYTVNTENFILSQRNENCVQPPADPKLEALKQSKLKQQTQQPQQQQPIMKKEPTFAKNNVLYIVQQYEDGRKFQGTVINGMKDGHGKLTYSDGAYYEGSFKNDKMEGQGTLFYGPDRPAYEGNWLADQFHGYGILYNENPLELNGCFNYNDFNLIQDFWVRYQGNFDCDNKSGEGKLILSNGEEFYGNFVNDFINGKGIFLTQEGQQVSGIWEDNILVQLDA